MKKIIIALCAIAGISVYANPLMEPHRVLESNAETNDTYVYNLTVSLKVPMVKYDKKNGVYTEYQGRTLKGYLYLDYITETKVVEVPGFIPGTFETNVVTSYVNPDIYLYDSKTKEEVKLNVDGKTAMFNILGKNYKNVSAYFGCENIFKTSTVAGYRNLEFCGNGSVKDYNVKVPVCTVCGITEVGNGKCHRIHSLSGQVIGMYSTGCGDEATAFESTECGFDPYAEHAINPCFGTWKATFKEIISND